MAEAKGKEAVVIFDRIAWVEDGERQEASKDDPVDLPVAEFDRLEALGAVKSPGKSSSSGAASGGGWPRTHDELDALGEEHDVTFEDGAKTADKVAALEAAGVEPPAGE